MFSHDQTTYDSALAMLGSCGKAVIGAKDGTFIVEIKPCKPPFTSADADWCREQKKKFGQEPGFF